MNLFAEERVSAHVRRIRTPLGVCMYLAEGDDRALLIDSGMGVGSLKQFLASLTAKPCDLLLTHGHCDHCGGSIEFATAYLNEADWQLERRHAAREHRISDVFHAPFGVPEGISEADFLPQREAPYLGLREDMRFDLGGVHVQCIAVPGHTNGCMVPIIPEDGIAIYGDAIGEGTLLHFPESVSIEEYRQGLLHLAACGIPYDTVLRFHGSCTSPCSILPDMIALCEDVMAGRDARIPAERMGLPGLFARPERHPGTEGNMIYSPDRIFRAGASRIGEKQ